MEWYEKAVMFGAMAFIVADSWRFWREQRRLELRIAEMERITRGADNAATAARGE